MLRPDPGHLDDLLRRIDELVPESLKSTRAEIRKTMRAGIESLLQRLDVVTREEFDAQAKLLARSRQRLDELQARLDALERERRGAD